MSDQLIIHSSIDHHSPNSIAEKITMGITQFMSMRKPKMRFPTSAPVRPKVRDNAAAITLE